MQKTLLAKLAFDVSQATPRQIEALKNLLAANFEGMDLSFELKEIDEEQAARTFRQQIIAEFTKAAESVNSESFESISDLLSNYDVSEVTEENTGNE